MSSDVDEIALFSFINHMCMHAYTHLYCCLVTKLYLCDPVNYSLLPPLAIGFPSQEYWSEFPFPPPGDLPNQGSNSHFLHWQVDSLPLSN